MQYKRDTIGRFSTIGKEKKETECYANVVMAWVLINALVWIIVFALVPSIIN